MAYLFRKVYPKIIFTLIDFVLRIFSKTVPFPENPKKLLLCNLAHLGDIVISSSVFPVIKQKWPTLEMHFLCSTISSEMLKNHPLISKIHILDHPKLNRSDLSKRGKLLLFMKQYFGLRRLVQKEQYDCAIDLSPFYPNAIPFLWLFKIPVRLGFVTGGFGPLLTHKVLWKHDQRYLAEKYKDLLDHFKIKVNRMLPYIQSSTLTRFPPKTYLMLHMGSGDEKKEWSRENWRILAKMFHEQGYFLIFTGKGLREKINAEHVSKGLGKTVNLVDCLSIKECITLIEHAKALISIDSFPVHVAYGLGIPTCLIFAKNSTPNRELWTPPSENVIFADKPDDCLHGLKKMWIKTTFNQGISDQRTSVIEEKLLHSTPKDLLDKEHLNT